MALQDYIATVGGHNIASAFGLDINLILLVVFAVLIIKGMALFKAARLNEKGWFWVILILNTAGILPLIYLYIRRRR